MARTSNNPSKKQIAHTYYDKRYTKANKINNLNKQCPNGYNIKATKNGTVVTVKCACHCSEFNCVGIFDENDAICMFFDTHS